MADDSTNAALQRMLSVPVPPIAAGAAGQNLGNAATRSMNSIRPMLPESGVRNRDGDRSQLLQALLQRLLQGGR